MIFTIEVKHGNGRVELVFASSDREFTMEIAKVLINAGVYRGVDVRGWDDEVDRAQFMRDFTSFVQDLGE